MWRSLDAGALGDQGARHVAGGHEPVIGVVGDAELAELLADGQARARRVGDQDHGAGGAGGSGGSRRRRQERRRRRCEARPTRRREASRIPPASSVSPSTRRIRFPAPSAGMAPARPGSLSRVAIVNQGVSRCRQYEGKFTRSPRGPPILRAISSLPEGPAPYEAPLIPRPLARSDDVRSSSLCRKPRAGRRRGGNPAHGAERRGVHAFATACRSW